MMDWEDVRVQLIDTPPITADFLEGYLSSMVRAADAAVLLVDLGDDDGPFAAEAVLERLAQVKTVLVGQPPAEIDDPTIQYVQDAARWPTRSTCPGRRTGWRSCARCSGALPDPRPRRRAAATAWRSCATAIYRFLNVIRVYTSSRASRPTWRRRSPARSAARVLQMAELVHRDFAEKLKSARIWGTGVFDGQTVTRDHVLHDKDVVELHV